MGQKLDLEGRVVHLEKRSRVLGFCFVLSILLITLRDPVSTLILGPAPSVRVVDSVTVTGDPPLQTWGNMSVGRPDKQCTLNLFGGAGKNWAGLFSDQEGKSGLDLRDREQRRRVLVHVEPDGSPSIQLFDAAGNVTWSAP